MKLRLVCVGRVSEPWLRRGVDEYDARIRRYLPLETIELKEEQGGRKPDLRLLRQREGERMLARVPQAGFLVALDEHGTAATSEDLARLLERHMLQGTPEIVWAIGGPYGLGEAVRERCDLLLSLSSLTLTHLMARLLLLEQIYRGFTILRNEPYHNR